MPIRTLIFQMVVGCSMWILGSGCGEKTQIVEQTSPPRMTNPNGAPTDPALSPSPFARPTAPAVIQPVAVPDDAAAALGVLTQAVRKFSAERRLIPANLDEVLRAGYITSIPDPPAGKKFVLNPKRLEVTLANK